ncbi:MAG TPA: hypothetical protein H9878_06120 [Candidatus Dietzia merdigallinarum]|nr:hypothetical protein [Candidatus Dietzia merdigallinarum]
MSMQPYQPNSIELKKQQVRKNSRNTAIALGVTVVSLGAVGFIGTYWAVVTVLAGIAAVYYGMKVRKAISGKDQPRELY